MARGLSQKGIDFRIASLEKENPLKSDFRPFAKKMLVLNQHKTIFEDRVTEVLNFLAIFKPTHVIACLGPSSLEVLRYVPKGVARVGLIQSNEPGPYKSLQNYKNHLDAVGAVSLEILKILKHKSGLKTKTLGDVRYGIRIPNRKIKAEKEFGKGPKKILYFGRIVEEQKRISLLPKILTEMDNLSVDYNFTLAGDGPDLKRITKVLIPWTKAGKVNIIGRLSQKKMEKVLSTQEIFLLFSDYEGLPLSLLEAMAHGLVPVVSDLGDDFKTLLVGTGSKLVRSDNFKMYARAVSYLCKGNNKMSNISKKCRKRIERRFTIQAMICRWIKFLRKTGSYTKKKISWPKNQIVSPPKPYDKNKLYLPIFRPFRRGIKKSTYLIRLFCQTSPT